MKKVCIFILALAAAVLSAAGYGSVNILDFKADALALGTDKEDWSPAFQKAIAKALDGNLSIYVPAGTYKLQKAINIDGPVSGIYDKGLNIYGDGRFCSKIKQMNPAENCVNWTGKTYKGSLHGGNIRDISLSGGKIVLNIKWHNDFTLRSCYIASGSEAGIWAEGWSSRFIDIIIRHCPKVGLLGWAHFNDITIRDGYCSRNGIDINLPGGARGVRISGIGIEHSAKCSIYVANSASISIRDCYFEGDAMHPVKGWEHNGSIVLSHNNEAIQVENCIFRGTALGRGHIVLGSNRNVKIEGNLTQIHRPQADALVIFDKPADKRYKFSAQDITVRHSSLTLGYRFDGKIKAQDQPLYFETAPGMMEQAVKNGCSFDEAARKKVVDGKIGTGKAGASVFQ